MRYLRAIGKAMQTELSRRRLLTFCIVAGLLIGLLAHGFMLTNKIPNHDDMRHGTDLTGAGLESGRFALYVFWKLLSTMSVPWLNGLLTLTFLSMAAFFLCDAFDLRSQWQAGAVTVVMLTFPINVSLLCYMYQAHAFGMGIMLATAAPWLIRRVRFGGVWAAVCIMLSTGVYQSFLMLSIGLLILFVIRRTARCEDLTGGNVWRMAIGCALAAIAGLLLYFAVIALLTKVGGVELNKYQNINQMGKLNLSTLPAKLAEAYQTVWDYYVADMPDYTTRIMRFAQRLLMLAGYGGLSFWTIRCAIRGKWGHAALLAVCAVLLPLAAAGVFMMGEGINVHQLALYSLIVLLLLPVIICVPKEAAAGKRHCFRQMGVLALSALFLGCGWSFTVVDNQAYLQAYTSFTRTTNAMNRLAAKIEARPEYRAGMRIATIGYMATDNPIVTFDYDLASRFRPFVGVRNEVDYLAPNTAVYLLVKVIGLPMEPTPHWEPSTPEEQAVVEAMPCYPAEGSIVFIGDLCVIKFS